MAYYMARVELFGASPDDYERLHANMDAIGIERDISFGDGTMRRMPIGTYFGSSSLPDNEAVRERIKLFANSLSPDKPAAIFVCEARDGGYSAFLYRA